MLTEQTDEWAEGRRYLGLELLARCSGQDPRIPLKPAWSRK
ncbi:hypothetical protein [Micrococcus yunnanensis]|nr:hypothetical protein [Micrococcus yunnanensis]